MLGAFRFFLALLVVLSHLVNSPAFGHVGYYAVRAFFVLSAYAMTAALNESYVFDGRRFWTNRFLRLAPIYLSTCALTALAIAADPVDAAHFMPRWSVAQTPSDIVGNLLVLPMLSFGQTNFMYIEPAWSLAVELFMYGALWLIVARGAWGALLCVGFGIYYHLVLLLHGAPFGLRYFSIESATLSFGLGAVVYFWRDRVNVTERHNFTSIVCAAWLINLLAPAALGWADFGTSTGFYLNSSLTPLVVVALLRAPLGTKLRRLDSYLGDLSYPIFLVQWVGGFIGYLLLAGKEMRGWELMLVSTPVILLTAAGLAWLQSRFIEPLRVRIRQGETIEKMSIDIELPSIGGACASTPPRMASANAQRAII